MKDTVPQRVDITDDDSMEIDDGLTESPVDLASEDRLKCAQLRRGTQLTILRICQMLTLYTDIRIQILSGKVDEAMWLFWGCSCLLGLGAVLMLLGVSIMSFLHGQNAWEEGNHQEPLASPDQGHGNGNNGAPGRLGMGNTQAVRPVQQLETLLSLSWGHVFDNQVRAFD